MVVTFVLCFTAPVYTTTTGKDYTVLSVLTTFSKDQIKNILHLSSYRVFVNSANSYLNLFIPIVAAFPFITAFCSERNSGNIRMTISRTGKFRYCLGKFISCMAGGGIAVMAGYILYGLFILPFFPAEHSLRLLSGQMHSVAGKLAADVILNVIGMFLYGAVSSLPAFLLAAVIHNKYLITCIPFMLLYILQSSVSQLETNAISVDNWDLFDKAQAFSLQSIQKLLFGGKYIWITIIEIILLSFISFLVFLKVAERKGDCGE